MDISVYISDLLYKHDCVIIPHFGGFVCNYKPADIHPIQHTIAPASKAISFNKNLHSNDGLLVNYVATRDKQSFTEAQNAVTNWVNASLNLLNKKEDIILQNIGKLANDIEGNLQFLPYDTVNYLPASYGLKTITAEPILRGKTIQFTEKFEQETKHTIQTRKPWKMAAIILLLVSAVALAELMWMGVEVKQLNLNEASVFSLLNNLFKLPEPAFKPIGVYVESRSVINSDSILATITTTTDSTELAFKEPDLPTATTTTANEFTETFEPNDTYYVVIGAFIEGKNIQAAKQRLQAKFPDSVILIQKKNRLTLLGYSVGNKFTEAQTQLLSAQNEDSTFWLLKK